MAAGSDLLDDAFFNTEVDEKVVSDLVGSLESELTGSGRGNSAVRVQAAANHIGNPAVCGKSNVQDSKMGLSQELAKPGTSVQAGVINSTRSTMDTAAGTTAAAGSGMTAGHSQSKTGAAGCVVTVVPDHGEGIGKTGSACVQTLNGSSVVINSHNLVSSASSTVPAATVVNNGPGSVVEGNVILPSTSIQTSLMDNAVTSTVVSSQPSVLNSVPTVTLVRPPMHTTGAVTSPSGSNTFLTSSVNVAHPACSGAQINKSESPKTAIQKTAQVTGTAAAVAKSPSTIAISPGGIRAIAPQVLAPRLPQPQQNAPNIQNIQLPPGMVLVRSESGQLLMIHQQTLAQMQAQSQSPMTPRPATPTSTPPVQITSVQAPGMPLIARQVTPTTIIKQGTPAQTTVPQRPPVLQQNTIVLGGAAATPGQAPVQPGSAATAVNQRAGTPGATGTPGNPTTTMETLENVKKCKNFLSTLIKLASSGKQSSETTASVKDLVKSLLEGKIEAEEFTSRLYRELNSSPQPYLVPFLKRSLPALRQMTPDSTAFIQQSQLPQASVQPVASSTALTTRLPLNRTTSPGAKGTMHQSPVISPALTPHSKPGLQQGALASTQVSLAQSPMVTFRGQSHSRIIMGHPQVVKQLQTGVRLYCLRPILLTASCLCETGAVINALHKKGFTGKDIAASKIAPKSSINLIIKSFKESGSIVVKKASGHPRKSSKRQDRLLKLIQLWDRGTTSIELVQEWQQASARTVRQRLLEDGLVSRRAAKKPHLSTSLQEKHQGQTDILQNEKRTAQEVCLDMPENKHISDQMKHNDYGSRLQESSVCYVTVPPPSCALCLPVFPVVKQALSPGAKVTLGCQSLLSVAQKNKLKEASGGTFKDDDDINDVASMAGVNLSEESARILATNSELVGAVTRSYAHHINARTHARTHTHTHTHTHSRLQNLLEKVTEVAQQKNITFKRLLVAGRGSVHADFVCQLDGVSSDTLEDDKYEQVSDVRAQLKFYEQLDQMEKQRKEEQEREILMKAAKVTHQDPEQLRLKQKAKEMQQQELNQIRQKEANMTALAAIGPRKKRKMESPVNGAGAEGSGSGPSSSGGANSGGSRPQRQRITRVNLRDLLFCLENERETSSSHLLYKGFLK
ncbi:unnamed protein product [Oncorhynchus mykiss]|uniref:TAFH domain-containing protein n=1 Tax=Oncorhynchus mykiss TaxID=8022 RepID=A0A060X959_ONCMY|nr:unnamed protein product [Oncorhynchus mykiss]